MVKKEGRDKTEGLQNLKNDCGVDWNWIELWCNMQGKAKLPNFLSHNCHVNCHCPFENLQSNFAIKTILNNFVCSLNVNSCLGQLVGLS